MAPKKQPRTVPELEAEVKKLNRELEQLRAASSLALGSGLRLGGSGRTSSIPAGVEEMILQVTRRFGWCSPTRRSRR